MGLTQQQELLARLFTDAALRERFGVDPEAVGREFRLSDEEARQIAAVRGVETFACSLLGKRLGEVREVLPLTAEVLSGDFVPLFREYAESAGAPPPGGPRADAVRFTDFLARRSVGPPWIGDLARYEAVWLGASPRLLTARFFRYPVPRLARAVLGGKPSGRVTPVPTVALWFRVGRGPLRHVSISLERPKLGSPG